MMVGASILWLVTFDDIPCSISMISTWNLQVSQKSAVPWAELQPSFACPAPAAWPCKSMMLSWDYLGYLSNNLISLKSSFFKIQTQPFSRATKRYFQLVPGAICPSLRYHRAIHLKSNLCNFMLSFKWNRNISEKGTASFLCKHDHIWGSRF